MQFVCSKMRAFVACATVTMAVAVLLSISVSAQNAKMTQATRAAEEKVALSSDVIIGLLRSEPGLLLEFKKALVRKAYEQARILDPDDLTDDAVFELVRQDNNIRVIATQEIERRGYIRAKPTAEEAQRHRVIATTPAGSGAPPAASGATGAAAAAAIPGRTPVSQEDSYWSTHTVAPPAATPQQTAPPSTPVQPVEPAPQQDRRREVQRASIPPPADTDSAAMTPIAPSELPVMLGNTNNTQPNQTSNVVNPYLPDPFRDEVSSPDAAARTAPRQPARPISSGASPSAIRRQPNPYADVPALYDLYSQVSPPTANLERFGAEIFRNGSGNTESLPMDLPVGPDYVIGPGDGLTIDLWGGVSQRLKRVVTSEGRIVLPEAGAVLVAGRNLGDVQREVQAILRTQFRDVQADVSLSRLRAVRIYVVGDVQSPGAYDISSMSTALNAFLAAGGPTDRGSIRLLKHYRGKQLIEEIDVYDLILHGVRSDVQRLQPGDTILVPPLGPQVTVEGMVRRPAIYETRGETSLADVLELAGGVLSTGTLRHIDVERIEAHQNRRMLSLDIPETNDAQAIAKAMADFKIQDGDRIRISPILPYSGKTVYLDGHVFHPGKYPYHDGMKLTDLIKSYRDLLPEPSQRHAEIIRLAPPDFKPVVLAFNLGDALDGKGTVPELKPFDTIRVFSRYTFEDAPEITVSGEVRSPGEHLTNGETHLRDAVYLAGGLTPDAKTDDAQVYRKLPNGEMKVLSVNLAKALVGALPDNILLEPKDRVIIQRDLAKVDPPSVMIQGEVARPGKYPLGENMHVSDLLRLAGGFKRGAYTDTADLARYVVEDGKKILGVHQEIALAKALTGDSDADVSLYDGDVVAIRQLSGWSNVGAAVTIRGEVAYPGTYGIHEGEKLSSIVRRAGGFRPSAYTYGAVLDRVQVREMAEKTRQEMIRRIEAGQNFRPSSDVSGGEQAALFQASLLQQQNVLAALKSQSAVGRLVVHVSSDVRKWEDTVNDIEVRAGDTIYVPKRPNFVLVSGQVFNSAAITYVPGRSASWYLQQSGGVTSMGDRKNAYVIRADGSVVGHGSAAGGFWHGDVLSLRLQPGDTVVVPEKFIGGSSVWKQLLLTGQIASNLAIAARVATSF
ncbi:MAG: SLBB domain-containing protein [Terriglobales bacterium]